MAKVEILAVKPYKVYLVPGQPINGSQMTYSFAMDHVSLDVKSPSVACQSQVTIDYSGTIEWYAGYTIGPFNFVAQYSQHFDLAPTFTFD